MAHGKENMKRTLKGIRNDLGLKQSEMADKLGMRLANYKKLEYGETRMTAVQMVNILGLANIDDYRELEIKK